MGDTGPCGPCSEIHFFQGNDVPCAEEKASRPCQGVACDCDRWLEIWNLVFMQFERDQGGQLLPLPKPSIDTGAGLERMAAVVQGKRSNYDTDLFQSIIRSIEAVSGKRYGHGESEDDVSMRVIADHARATTFLVGDGVLPSNEGRGYVLRRIMRRAIRHGKRLGLEKVFLARVAEAVIAEMGSAYPEIRENRAFVVKVAEQEEEAFRRTLDKGLAILEERDPRTSPAGASGPSRGGWPSSSTTPSASPWTSPASSPPSETSASTSRGSSSPWPSSAPARSGRAPGRRRSARSTARSRTRWERSASSATSPPGRRRRWPRSS